MSEEAKNLWKVLAIAIGTVLLLPWVLEVFFRYMNFVKDLVA